MREYLLAYRVKPKPARRGPWVTVRVLVEAKTPKEAGQLARDQIRREMPGAELGGLVSRTVRVTKVRGGVPHHTYREA